MTSEWTEAVVFGSALLIFLFGVAIIGCFEALQSGARKKLFRDLGDEKRAVDTLAFLNLRAGLFESMRFLLGSPRYLPNALVTGVLLLGFAVAEPVFKPEDRRSGYLDSHGPPGGQ